MEISYKEARTMIHVLMKHGEKVGLSNEEDALFEKIRDGLEDRDDVLGNPK